MPVEFQGMLIARFYPEGTEVHRAKSNGNSAAIVFEELDGDVHAITPGHAHYDELVALQDAWEAQGG